MPDLLNYIPKGYEEVEPTVEAIGIPQGYEEVEYERTVAPEEHGVLSEFVAGLGRGALRVIGTPANLADIAGEALGWEGLEKVGEAGAEAIEEYIKESPRLKKSETISGNILDNPQLWTDPRWYASLAGEGIPTIVAMLIPGTAAARIAKTAGYGIKGIEASRIAGGLSAAMGLEAGGAAEQIRQHEKQTGEEIPISNKLLSVMGTGIVAGSLEYVPIFTIFGRTGGKKLVSRILRGMALEGGTEGAQEIVSNAFAELGYQPEQRMIDGVIESVVGGVMLGGGMGAISRATNFQERVEEADEVEVSEILEEAETEMEVEVEPEIPEGYEEIPIKPVDREVLMRKFERPEVAPEARPEPTIREVLAERFDLKRKVVEEKVEEPIKKAPEKVIKEPAIMAEEDLPPFFKEEKPEAVDLEPKYEPAKKGWETTPSDDQETWGEMMAHVEDVEAQNAPEIKILEDEFKTLKSSRKKVDVARKKAIKEEIGEIKAIAGVLGAEYENLVVEKSIAFDEEALEKAKKLGLKEEDEEAFFEDYQLERSTERPYIETNYKKTYQEIFDEVLAEYLGKPAPAKVAEKEIKAKAIPEVVLKEPKKKEPTPLRAKANELTDAIETVKPDTITLGKDAFKRAIIDGVVFYKRGQDKYTVHHIAATILDTKQAESILAKVEKPKVVEPTTGMAWIKNQQKPIMSARKITRGKNKGKFEVILTMGRDAEGNIIPGAKKIVLEKEIVRMPEVDVDQAKARIKASTTDILKGERGSFSIETKEGAATFEDFSIVGKDFISRGADTFNKFVVEMKKAFGEVWESVKHLAKEIYKSAKGILATERGAITIREEIPEVAKPVKEAPPIKKAVPKEEIETLETEIQDLRKQFKQEIKVTPIKEAVLEATGKLRLSDIVKEARITTREAYEAIARKKKGIFLLRSKEKRMNALIKARANKAARQRVTEIINGLKKVNTEKMDPIQAKAINDILSGLDLTKLSERKKLRLLRTKQYLDANLKDTDIPTYVLEDLERLDKTAARDLTVDDLESVNMAVLNHVHLNKTKQTIKVDRKERKKEQVLDESLSEMKPAKKVKDNIVSSQTGKMGRLKKVGRLIADTFGIRHDHYDLIIETLSGPNSIMDKILYRQVDEGTDVELKHRQNTFKKFQDDIGDIEKLKIKDQAKWVNETVKVGRFNLTHGERMALYNHSLSADNRRSITEGGFGFKFSEDPNKVHKMTEAELTEILDSLTPAELKIAGEPVRNLYDSDFIAINKVFLEKNGFDMPKAEGPYYHKDTMPLARGLDLEKEISIEEIKGTIRIGLQKGRLEKRKGVALPIYLNSLFYDINQSVAFSSAYVGLEIALSNASSLLYDPTFRLNLSNRYGEQTWKEIEKGLRDISGEHQTYTTTEKLLIKAKNRLSVAMLGINPFVMAKQVLSLPVYLPYIKSRYLAMGVIDTIWHPKQIAGRHKTYSPKYLERVEGGYSRDVADVFKAGAEKRVYAGKKDIKERFMSGIKLFDSGAVTPGMQGAVLQVLDEFDAGKLSREPKRALGIKDSDIAGLSSEQKMKLAYKFADWATVQTQPMFSPAHRSSLSRGSTIEKLATMFGAFTNQALNLTRRSYRDAIRTGDKEAYVKLSKSLMTIFVINTLGVMAIDDIRDRLYGREERPFFGRILSSWAAYMFFVRDLASSVVSKIERGTFLGYDVSLPVSRIPELLSNSIANGVTTLIEKDIKKRKKAAINFIDDSLELSMMMYGIPYATPKKLVVRAVMGAPEVDSAEVKEFKKNLKEINVVNKNYKELLEEDKAKARKYDIKTKKIRRFVISFRAGSRDIAKLKKKKETVMKSKLYTDERKKFLVEKINTRTDKIAEKYNKYLEKE